MEKTNCVVIHASALLGQLPPRCDDHFLINVEPLYYFLVKEVFFFFLIINL